MEARIVAIYNLKGGTAKSVTAANMAAALALSGSKVLVVDLDPQGSASKNLGVRSDGKALRDLLVAPDSHDAKGVVESTSVEGVSLMAGGTWLSGVETTTSGVPAREFILSQVLEGVREGGEFEYIFVDCPPSPGLLNILALFAADSYLVPVQTKGEAVDGFVSALAYLGSVNSARKRMRRPPLQEDGILMCLYDPRTTLSRHTVNAMRKKFGDRIYKSVIHRNIDVSQGYLDGHPVVASKPRSKGALNYRQAAREFVGRLALTKEAG